MRISAQPVVLAKKGGVTVIMMTNASKTTFVGTTTASNTGIRQSQLLTAAFRVNLLSSRPYKGKIAVGIDKKSFRGKAGRRIRTT